MILRDPVAGIIDLGIYYEKWTDFIYRGERRGKD
jgi:hypothetical protein